MTTVIETSEKKKRAVIDSAIIYTHQHRDCFVRSADGYAYPILTARNRKIHTHTHTHVYETYNDNLNPFSIVCVCKHVWVPLRDNISHGETMCIFGACACARPFFSPFHARLEHIGPQQYYIILLSTQ